MVLPKQEILKALTYKTSRSGGKGGQHVNKVSSKVELNFDLKSTTLFTEEEKFRLFQKLANRINAEGILQIITEEERSQLQNKERSVQKLLNLLKTALFIPKLRKASKPNKSAIEKRLKSKQINAMKKISRKTDWND
jgi:ribosome-associated protein